jgi:L-rhamnose-H+ transport protein
MGGFVTNFVWCLVLLIRNRTGYQYFTSRSREPLLGQTESGAQPHLPETYQQVPILTNYLLCALAGATWYFQFFFYTMGETQMGRYRFSSWTLHMASIIIFSSLWGIGFREWKGAGKRATQLLALALLLLIGSTAVVGYGNYLGLRQ